MARNELTDKELEILKIALSSSIKKDFLTKDVSYQTASEIKYLANSKRETKNSRTIVQKSLREDFNASMVSVGSNKVAIVKRPDDGK